MAAAAVATPAVPSDIKILFEMREMFNNGFLTPEEWANRRLQLIDELTNTSGDKTKPRGPQHAVEVKKVYANRHFDKTNEDAMTHAEYLVINAPMKFNGHLFTGAAPENPFSFKTDAVPIDPNRGKVLPTNTKKFDETTVVYTTDQPGLADRMQQVERLEEERRRLGWELFIAAGNNDCPRIKELLDRGADVDQRDFDSESTPIMHAASKGKKHAVYYLGERGATINARNIRGECALHEAVKLRMNEMALWLVKHGADIHLENYRGFSAYDLALPWLQKEMADERKEFLKRQKQALQEVIKGTPEELAAAAAAAPELGPDAAGPDGAPPPEMVVINTPPPSKKKPNAMEVLQKTQVIRPDEGAYAGKYGNPVNKKVVRTDEGAEIDLKSTPALQKKEKERGPTITVPCRAYLQNGVHRMITITNETTAKDLTEMMADKIGMGKYSAYLEVVEQVKDEVRSVADNAALFPLKKNWPLVLGPTGNETELYCKFIVAPKKGTPSEIAQIYQSATIRG